MSPWRGLTGLLTLLAAGVVLATVIVLLWAQLEDMDALARRLEAAAPGMSALRIGMIGLVIATWPRLVPRFARDPAVRRGLLAARWRVAAWLVILEITLGQGLVGAFLAEILR